MVERSRPEAVAGRPPLLVLAGMPRTATTSLFHILGDHPDVYPPFRKELGYFWFQHDRGNAWLERVFRRRGPGQVGIDATPEYFFAPEAARRMAEYGAGIRVVLGVRDPPSFALSLHREYARRRFDVPSLADFVAGYRYRRRRTEVSFSLADGVVTRRIEDFRAALGDRLLLFDFAAFRTRPLRVLEAIERFAGLRRWYDESTFQNLHLNARDRRSLRWLDYLLGRESVAATLRWLLPRRMLVRGARSFYRASASPASPARARSGHDAEAEVVGGLVAEATALGRLFAASPVVLGSGRPFDLVDQDADEAGYATADGA